MVKDELLETGRSMQPYEARDCSWSAEDGSGFWVRSVFVFVLLYGDRKVSICCLVLDE